MEFSIKDSLRASIEMQSCGKETIIYDEHDNPNIMVRVDAYDKQFVNLGTTGKHPAFIIDNEGTEVSEIWVAKYLSSRGNNDCPISWHGTDAINYMSFNDAKTLCRKKGKGWHLMTNLEYSAIMLYTWTIGRNPIGAASHNRKEHGTHECFLKNEVGDPKFSTHDGSVWGIVDFGLNFRQYVDGIKVGPNKEALSYWGNQETKELVNCFDDETYIDESITLDWGTDSNNPHYVEDCLHYNTDYSRCGAGGDPLYTRATDFPKVRCYTPQIPTGGVLYNHLCEMGLIPYGNMVDNDSIVGNCYINRHGLFEEDSQNYPEIMTRSANLYARAYNTQSMFEYRFEFLPHHIPQEYHVSFRPVYIAR